jgi:glycosyltransferase involved in cell wall biosynthesis
MDLSPITIAVPLLNEAPRLPALLDALAAQNYPRDLMQILLLDGGSEDGTVALARRAAAEHGPIQVLANPGRSAAAALNLALDYASGAYFVRFDARCRPASNYVACVAARLGEGKWAGVGGPQIAMGDTPAGRVQALALNHPLGTGAPRYRRADQPLESETLYLGAYPVAWLRRVGGWDETFVANEDYEINTRLRKAGGRLLIDPAIRSTYLARDGLGELARQYARYGAWRTVTWRKHPDALMVRHLTPALFVAGLALGVAFSLITPWPLLILATLYLSAIGIASLQLSLRRNLAIFPRLMLVFITLHLVWGGAFWWAWLRRPS